MVVENEELIQDFIDLPPAFAGKLVEVDGKLITIEKNVRSATETRELIDLEISPKSSIFIRIIHKDVKRTAYQNPAVLFLYYLPAAPFLKSMTG